MNKPQPEHPFVIGLTGNIATGKSSVAAMLADLGAEVIDADKLAHQVMRADTPAHQQIAARFGAEVLQRDGQIDRAKLGAIVFGDALALRELEAIVHPAVLEETYRLLETTTARVCVVEAIKLLETSLRQRCQAIWVVTCKPQIQAQRLMARSGLTDKQAWLRINAQESQAAKAALADIVIDNSGDLAQTRAQVVAAWQASRLDMPNLGTHTND